MGLPLLDDEIAIVRAVFDAWLGGSDGATVKEIALASKLSEKRVRSLIAVNGGAVRGTQFTRVSRPQFERNYRTRIHDRQCDGWTPCADYLRDEIRRLKGTV